ncbi:MAG: discoidin domain-containing protein, partial [Planctomycetota bacterium]|nr:discoidin domain-containing protein [Planctomycetota bacterium]
QGSNPKYAVDNDPRTWWEAPAESLLDVDLGESFKLIRVRVESAGRFLKLPLNTVSAELLTSDNGRDYKLVAKLNARPGGKHQPVTHSWIDVPILPPVVARHVRLRVTNPGADGVIRVAGFDLFGTRADTAERK